MECTAAIHARPDARPPLTLSRARRQTPAARHRRGADSAGPSIGAGRNRRRHSWCARGAVAGPVTACDRSRATRVRDRRSGRCRCMAAQACGAAHRHSFRVQPSGWLALLARRAPLDCDFSGWYAVGIFQRAHRLVSPRAVAAGRDADSRHRRLCARDRARVLSGWSINRVLR